MKLEMNKKKLYGELDNTLENLLNELEYNFNEAELSVADSLTANRILASAVLTRELVGKLRELDKERK